MSTEAPTLDDIKATTHNLAQLLDTLVESLMNVTYPATATDLTRVGALSIIARDMSEGMIRDIGACLHADCDKRRQAKTEAAA